MQTRKHDTLRILAAMMLAAGLAATPALASNVSAAKQATPDFRTDFSKHDSDGDGYISLREFKALNKNEQAFKEADADGDGRLNQDEFVKARAIDQRVRLGEYIDDAWITTKVKSLLVKEEGLTGLDIKVETQDGVVQLSGSVNDSGQVDSAGKVAAGVKGVKSVRNNLQYKP